MALTQVRTGGVKDDAITSGKIPNNAVGTTEIADESISLAKLPHGDGSTNGKFLRSNTGADPTWEAVSSSDATKMPLAGGTFTGDVVFDNQANAGRDITWDESNDALEFADLAKAEFGTDGDSKIWFTGSGLFIENGTGHTTFTAQAGYGFSFLSGTDQLFEILAGANRVAFRKPIYIQGPDADTGGQITLYESNSVLDNYVVLEANGTMGANYTFTLPADGGSANQYLKTDGSGGTSWATVSAGAGGATALSLNDGVKVNFGADNDLRIEGGSGNSVIQHQDTGAGDLFIDAQNSNIYLRSGDGSTGEENAIVCENNGKVKLHHSGTAKLETTTTGVQLTGTVSFANATESTTIGTNAGEDLDSSGALRNTFIGYDAGKNVTSGAMNVAVGRNSLSTATTTSHAVAIGNGAFAAMVDESGVAVGSDAGYNCTGDKNTFVGRKAGYDTTSGTHNTCVGNHAMYAATTADYCTIMGNNAGSDSSYNADHNTFYGHAAGWKNTTGSNNTFLGMHTGNAMATGSYNVFLGQYAGGTATGDSNSLYIARSNTASANASTWIYGDSNGACVQGNNSSSWSTSSDRRLKKNIADNNVGLSVIEQVKVKNFKFKQYNRDEPNHVYTTPVTSEDTVDLSSFPVGTVVDSVLSSQGDTSLQLGVIAQELESVCPNAVKTDATTGAKSVITDELFWHMLNAIKELSTKVKALESA